MATGFSSAQQQGPGPQAPPAGSVFLTRDTRIFRTVKSPIAVLAGRLYALLSGSSALSAAARRCLAHAVLDHALPNEGAYSAELDAQIREHFASSPPAVVLVQGPFRVDFINEDPPSPGTPKSMSTINTMGSSLTTTSGPSSLLDVVFLGYTLHNELNRCQREDREQYAKLAFFALTSLVHESAHWLFTKMHGYRRDEARFSVSSNTMSQGKGSGMMGGAAPANVNISQAGQKAEDPLISFGQRPDDAGARAVDTLFGCTALLVSWADGDTEVLKRKLKPDVQGERPALSTADIEGLIEARLPPILDITGQPPILIGGPPPKWSTHDAYLVTSQNAANSFCAHGMCRIGQLF